MDIFLIRFNTFVSSLPLLISTLCLYQKRQLSDLHHWQPTRLASKIGGFPVPMVNLFYFCGASFFLRNHFWPSSGRSTNDRAQLYNPFVLFKLKSIRSSISPTVKVKCFQYGHSRYTPTYKPILSGHTMD